MFSTLRQGSVIYILQKGDTIPELSKGQITSIQFPTNYGYLNAGTLDITAKVDGETLEFKQLPSQLSIANYGNTVICETAELMCSEIENMIRDSKQILENIPYHEQVIEVGESMLKELNPQFAKQKDQEDKINNLENKVGSMESKLDDIASMLTKALNKQ